MPLRASTSFWDPMVRLTALLRKKEDDPGRFGATPGFDSG